MYVFEMERSMKRLHDIRKVVLFVCEFSSCGNFNSRMDLQADSSHSVILLCFHIYAFP